MLRPRFLLPGSFLILTLIPICFGQSPRGELFMGYSFARAGNKGFNGWNVAVVGNYNDWFGIAVDVSGHYASQDGFVESVPVTTDHHLYALRAGPRFKLPAFRKLTPFAQALLGGNYIRATSNSKVTQGTQVSQVKSRGFAAAVGFGFDYDLSDAVAFRILQADYSVLRVPGGAWNGFRLATGIVFKFD
jgi:hypothetical protein